MDIEAVHVHPHRPGLLRVSTAAGVVWVPDDPRNLQRAEIAAWEAAGGEIAPIPRDLDARKAEMLHAMLVRADTLAATLREDYTETEPETWPTQEAEARAVTNGTLKPSEAAFLMQLAEGVYQRVTPLAERVLAYAALYRDAGATMIVMRRRAQAAIKGAESHAALDEIAEELLAAAVAERDRLAAAKSAIESGGAG